LMTLIRAFRRVRDEVPDAVLAVMGRPFEDVAPYRAEIARLGLADAISFRPDYVPLEMISSVLGWADLLVLPYERAWNSGIILSAYAFGKPVVSTAVSGLSEVVEDGRTGLVVPPGDADALAAAIVRILADDRLRAAMSEAARAAAARHSWAAIAEQTERAYRAG
jgi:glycosyltransferase involved in cell wall biosynthesis